MRDKIDNKSMYIKLGEAFSYGITSELHDLIQNVENNDDAAPNFYAAISYMGLNKILSMQDMHDINELIEFQPAYLEQTSIVIEKICKIVFSALKQKYKFRNLDELIDEMNEFVLDDFCISYGKDIVNHSFDGICLYEEELYYIIPDRHGSQFIKIPVAYLDEDLRLDEQYEYTVLGFEFSKIVGFDSKFKKIYLIKLNLDHLFAYDILTKTIVDMPYKLVSIKDSVPYVITHDNYFARIEGNELYKMVPHKTYNEYIEDATGFIIRPVSTEMPFFFPYHLNYEGVKSDVSPSICHMHLWQFLEDVVYNDPKDKFTRTMLRLESGRDYEVALPKDFTLKGICSHIEAYLSLSNLSPSRSFIVFSSICDMLVDYMSDSEDATELLYMLIDTNRIIESINGRKYYANVITEDLYFKLKKIVDEDQEKHNLYPLFYSRNYQKLQKEILGSRSDQYKEEAPSLIGTFDFSKNGLSNIVTMDKHNGIVIGNVIIPCADLKHDGIVTYDFHCGVYIVTTNYELSYKNKLNLLERYNLPNEENIAFIVQKKIEVEL